jgi:hypothetical protein
VSGENSVYPRIMKETRMSRRLPVAYEGNAPRSSEVPSITFLFNFLPVRLSCPAVCGGRDDPRRSYPVLDF